jgi:hypothetical protein
MQQTASTEVTARWARLKSFASLTWYDALIEFIFRFVAKTSEPLLALGIVYSAADILSHGHLSGNNQLAADLWALTQATAIESSGGVVLVYGLTSLKEKDEVKAGLYFVLSALLALAGSIMLFMQLAGWEQQQNDTPFMLVLFGLRCVVSVGYIYLCRAKHIRFTDLKRTEANPPDDTIKQLTEQVALLAANIGQITATVTEVKTTVTEITAQGSVLPMHNERSEPLRTEPTEPLHIVESEANEGNKKELIRKLLRANPQATLPEIMEYANVKKSYASTARSQIVKEKHDGFDEV